MAILKQHPLSVEGGDFDLLGNVLSLTLAERERDEVFPKMELLCKCLDLVPRVGTWLEDED